MDRDKARMSCGGEQDPKRCIIKGYRPEGGIAYYYEQRLRGWCNDNKVNFVEAPGGGRALATCIILSRHLDADAFHRGSAGQRLRGRLLSYRPRFA